MTTQWQSVFAVKSRTVEFWAENATEATWAGALGLGQTSPSIAIGNTGTHAQLSVDANGVVTLSSDDGAGTQGVQVYVHLDDTDATSPTQMIGMSAFGAYQNTGVAVDGDSATDPINLAFDPSTGAATPATVSFSAYTPPITSVYLGMTLSQSV